MRRAGASRCRGAAEDLKLSRGAGGGLETVRKDFGATERLVDGGTAEVIEAFEKGRREPLRRFAALRGGWCRCEGFGAMWQATGRRLEEPLDGGGTRSQPERPVRAGKATGRCRERYQAHGLSDAIRRMVLRAKLYAEVLRRAGASR